MRCSETTVRAAAEALFDYNTTQGRHFIIHDGGYEGIATALARAGFLADPPNPWPPPDPRERWEWFRMSDDLVMWDTP